MTPTKSRRQWLPTLPILNWGRHYDRATLASDLTAALIVTIMLIPQSLAYAMLAGLPLEVGLYACIAPLLLYTIFGSSRVLAVGPVAIVSLMTATAIGSHATAGSPMYWSIALTLAFLSGTILLLMGIFRLGFLANFLSTPVISGFITASALLIASSQLKNLMGVPAEGHNFIELITSLMRQIPQAHGLTLIIGVFALLFLLTIRLGLKQLLMRWGIAEKIAGGITRTAPIFLIALTILLAWIFQWQSQGVKIVGTIPQGLPPFTLPLWDMALWKELALPALLISMVGFIESVSIGQTLATQRRQRIEPNQELVALGASNLSASFTGGFPVTGGFARSVVNFDAGAQTPAAGAFAAICIMLSALLLTPALYYLPQAILSATIMVAVLSLVDIAILKRTWAYSKSDFAAVAATLLVTLLVGVEAGLLVGIGVSLALFIFRTSQPHIATIGLVPGTEHFRNVLRHDVLVSPQVVSLRVDGSLYFANTRSLEDRINQTVADNPKIQHLLLQCSAINDIDASALASLESLNQQLREAGITLHLTEIKGPVMDKLQQTHFLHDLSGKIFLTHYQAIQVLSPEIERLSTRAE